MRLIKYEAKIDRRIDVKKKYDCPNVFHQLFDNNASSLASYWLYTEHKNFESESIELRNDYVNYQRELIKNEVEKAIDYVIYKKDQTEERVRQQIKSRVYEAHALATHIHNLHKYKRDRQVDLKKFKFRYFSLERWQSAAALNKYSLAGFTEKPGTGAYFGRSYL